MNVTKEEFLEWKQSYVTQEVFKVLIDRIEEAKEILSYNAGNSQLDDKYITGMIHAFREVMQVDWEDN